MELRALEAADVTDAMALSTQAGWNQVPADWHRLLELASEGCFAGVVDDELVATATTVTYDGSVAWIGMVLVEESHRGQGYGTAILRHALECGLDSAPVVGLDATDQGRRVYETEGFETVCPIERWSGVLEPTQQTEAVTTEATPSDSVTQLDRTACGVDRTALLDSLGSDATCFVYGTPEDPTGYAVLRPGRTAHHLGPVVATGDRELPALLSAVARQLDGETVVVDLLATDKRATLSDAGLS